MGDSDKFVKSPPRIANSSEHICPNCKGKTIFEIEVDVNHPQLRSESKQVGRYLGCAACPYASPMIMTAAVVS